MERFETIQENNCEQIVEKKSKFIANIIYVETKEQAEIAIKQINKKYFDARHNCYAYITFDEENNKIERCSDDGEPSGTAGAPMLNILNKNGLCNVLVVVTRYFGGILLGTGGLVRAYSEATLKVLENTKTIIMQSGQELKVEVEYKDVESFRYFCRKNFVKITQESYENNVEFVIETTKPIAKLLNGNLDNFRFNIVKIEIIRDKYVKIDKDIKIETEKI